MNTAKGGLVFRVVASVARNKRTSLFRSFSEKEKQFYGIDTFMQCLSEGGQLGRQVRAGAGRCGQVWAGAGTSGQVWAGAGRCRQVQAGAGRCRQVQAGAGRCRQWKIWQLERDRG